MNLADFTARDRLIVAMNTARLEAHSRNYAVLRDALVVQARAAGLPLIAEDLAIVGTADQLRATARLAVARLMDAEAGR